MRGVDSRSPAFAEDKLRRNDCGLERPHLSNDISTRAGSSCGLTGATLQAHPVQEITHLSLSADLVALSACDTATGKLEGEEGIDGVAEPFVLAGAKSVVGALWDVDDSATDTLMRSFNTGSKNQGGAYVPPFFGGMYAPS